MMKIEVRIKEDVFTEKGIKRLNKALSRRSLIKNKARYIKIFTQENVAKT